MFVHVTVHEMSDDDKHPQIRIIVIRNESHEKICSIVETRKQTRRELSVTSSDNSLSWQRVTEISEIMENFDFYFNMLNQ